ncbi:hypothetical protein VUJ46_16940 [Chryseobacterium sp. MYb264]|uniref:hypothetical protein n=1 Tax=Chryseobacterium sp. MYb264 TaxID=2745153 RepID=UPI002E10C86E|nr:hypothetical protein VUJ46_16940 [Chryseobacterium sp. MYb264]
MKNVITALLFVGSINFLYSQANTISTNMAGGTRDVFYNIKSNSAGRMLNYDEITGSPYLNKNFSLAKIEGTHESVPVRYNSLKDEIEFQKDGKTMVLPNEETFSKIDIVSPKSVLVRLDTHDDLTGYFFELVNGKNALYKKIKTKFIDVVPATNSYATDRPASFKTLDPVYYIAINEKFVKKPKNEKEIIALIPEKKDAISQFVKSNKIKFNKEEDLVKLVNFLNQ